MSTLGHITNPSSNTGVHGAGSGGVPNPPGSILGNLGAATSDGPADTEAFTDLHLDQIVTRILGRTDDDLAPLFHTPLPTADDIERRHEVFRDLQKPDVLAAVREFVSEMRSIRKYTPAVANLAHHCAAEGAFIEAVTIYTNAVEAFAAVLPELDLDSHGLSILRDHVAAYVASDRFTTLVSETGTMAADLATVRYTMAINGRRVRVGRSHGELDYGEEIEKTFARFSGDTTKRYTHKLSSRADIGHVGERILQLVARLYPDTFGALDEYVERNSSFVEETLVDFARDIRFYLAVLAFIQPMEQAGLSFCYPTITREGGAVRMVEGFDLALASRLVRSRSPIVTNDFSLTADERIMVVTGPNQGGKTTFARMFGQIHHLAAIGCPIPGREASLPIADRIFTHFEREERVENLRGKLADDLVRVRSMLDHATPQTVLIMNETLNSTTLADARFLGERLLRRIGQIRARCVYVTFVDELASLDGNLISMVGGVDPGAEAVRTYKIVRRQADGRAYAMALAERYGLTYEQMKGRIEC